MGQGFDVQIAGQVGGDFGGPLGVQQ